MADEEVTQILEEIKADYKQKQRVFRGLQILAKYDDDMDFSFEHDQMWVSSFDKTITQMTKEDVIELAKCGWFENEDSWSHF